MFVYYTVMFVEWIGQLVVLFHGHSPLRSRHQLKHKYVESNTN